MMLGDSVNELMTMYDLEEFLQTAGYDVTYVQLSRWADEARNIGFPVPARTLGRYKYYNPHEVEEWVYLWLKATSRIREANQHGTRTDS
jgi:hypothetical protein